MKKRFLFSVAIIAAFSIGFTASDEDLLENKAPQPEEETVDERIPSVIPEELREQVEEFIQLYDGVTPPNVEGAYFMNPEILVKSTLSYDSPGKTFASEYMNFTNQNMEANTIDMTRVQGGGIEWMKGSGAFISGYDNCFTIYFNMAGEVNNVPVTEAIVVSGVKTDGGIKNLSWAFILKEKGNDPYGSVVPVGTIRSFIDSDGISESTSWPYGEQYARSWSIVDKLEESPSLPCSHVTW